MKDINSFSTPINKTAALVTMQSASDDLELLMQDYQSIGRALSSINSQPEVNMSQIFDLKAQRKEIKRRIAAIKQALNEGMDHYIVNECRKIIPKEHWEIIIHRARQAHAKDLAGDTQE